jgi:hypothetical protein
MSNMSFKDEPRGERGSECGLMQSVYLFSSSRNERTAGLERLSSRSLHRNRPASQCYNILPTIKYMFGAPEKSASDALATHDFLFVMYAMWASCLHAGINFSGKCKLLLLSSSFRNVDHPSL